MRIARLVVPGSIVVLTLLASTLHAQACVGSASFASGPIRLGAGADFTDGVKAFGVQMAFGSASGPFATAGLASVDYDDLDESGTAISLGGGYAIDLGPTSRAQFCPLLGFARQTGPNFDTGFGILDVSSRAFNFGGSFGGTASSTPTMDFVPFVGAAVVSQKVALEFEGESESVTEDYTVISVGAGFVLNKHLTIQPRLAFPVGLEDGEPTYGITFGLNFGGPPRTSSRRR